MYLKHYIIWTPIFAWETYSLVEVGVSDIDKLVVNSKI